MSTTSKLCMKCNKGKASRSCAGCNQSWCTRHFEEHRQNLYAELQIIFEEFNTLKRNLLEDESSHPFFLSINEWESQSINKIQIAAEMARKNLRIELDQIKDDGKTRLGKIAEELRVEREADNYTEVDLCRWSSQLADIQNLFKEIPLCKVNENVSSVLSFPQVSESTPCKPPSTLVVSSSTTSSSTQCFGSVQELFDKATNFVSLLENGFVGTYTGDHCCYPTLFGKNSYLEGINIIYFQVEKKSNDNLFFGIVTSTQQQVARIFDTPSANGWWGFDVSVMNGRSLKDSGKKILQTGDIVKLTLDCTNTQIMFENYRTGTVLKSQINLATCPLPWRLVVSLSRSADTLSILW